MIGVFCFEVGCKGGGFFLLVLLERSKCFGVGGEGILK